jgi:hypothetical protein
MHTSRDDSRSRRRRAPLGATLAALLSLAWLAGCTETRTSGGYYKPLPPDPRPMEPPPPDARANALVLNVSASPVDTNGNGYPDLVQATVHLFDTRYPTALWEEGTFVFRLYAAGQAGESASVPLREWRFEGEQLDQLRAVSVFGGCYHFRLSLLDEGTDKLPISMGDVACRFEPADGRPPTYASEVVSVRIGHRILVPQLRWEESATASQPPRAADEAPPALEPIK